MKGRIIKKITQAYADRNKKLFLKNFHPQWLNKIAPEINATVICFSGAAQFADQLLSLSSFYLNVGIPVCYKIYSDGSHSEEQIAELNAIQNVKVFNLAIFKLPMQAVTKFPTLKKIEILDQTVIKRTTIFTDSDVLYFKEFSKYVSTITQRNWYLVDESFNYFDEDYLKNANKGNSPLNLGLLILNTQVDWNPVINYIKNRFKKGVLSYWSDQTAAHMLALKQNFKSLPVNDFVVGGHDNFTFGSAVNYNSIAVRHFVGPVRHKMWQYSWKKVLGI